jgi:hypothetical protein
MNRNIPIENITIDTEGITLSVRGRNFRVLYEYFPEFLAAPLRCIFDVEFAAWSMTADSNEIVWDDEDTFHWREIEMDVHARNFFDQSLNEGCGKDRPAPFETKVIYAPWTARGRERD